MSFEYEGEHNLSVTIETKRLELKSVVPEDFENYYSKLYSCPEVMKSFAYGVPLDSETTAERVEMWAHRWEQNDPFSAFSVRLKEEDTFAGQVSLLKQNEKLPGAGVLAYLFSKDTWGQGIASEAVLPVVNDYATELAKQAREIHSKAFTTLYATARVDNMASNKILEKAGMALEETKEAFGALRHHYRKAIA
jgi:RimJ/RimL family protein N-acetyltransferase